MALMRTVKIARKKRMVGKGQKNEGLIDWRSDRGDGVAEWAKQVYIENWDLSETIESPFQ